MIAFSEVLVIREEHLFLPKVSVPPVVLYDAVTQAIEEGNLPAVVGTIEPVASGRLGALFGCGPDFLVIRFGRKFPEHLVLIGSNEVGGAGVAVTFRVLVAETSRRKLLRLLRFAGRPELRETPGSELTTAELSDLTALVSVVRSALDSVLELLPGASSDLDPLGPHALDLDEEATS